MNFASEHFSVESWVRYYYLFQEHDGRNSSLLHRICLKLRRVLHVHRNKCINFQKGSQWFSITDEFARYVLSQRDWIRDTFRLSDLEMITSSPAMFARKFHPAVDAQIIEKVRELYS